MTSTTGQSQSAVEAVSPTRTALVAGATGLVGKEILALLLADSNYSAVHAVGRRAPDAKHPKLVVHLSSSLISWASPAVDDVFIALGASVWNESVLHAV